MTENPAPTTSEELRTELDEVLRRAHRNDVDVAGMSYPLRHSQSDIPDWEISIVELSK